MSAPKHTPGPWTVEAIPDSRGLGRRVFTDRIEIKQEGSISLVACLFHKNWSLDGERDSANARLIAAAPDMLEALIDVIAGHSDPELFLPQVRAAVRKATGGAQ